MPKITLELLDEFLRHYALEAPFIYPIKCADNNMDICTLQTLMNQNNIHPVHPIGNLGTKAYEFIQQAKQRYHHGELSPPINLRTMRSIYERYDELNIDLIGNENGVELEQKRAKEWNTYWHNVLAEFQREGRNITDNEINKVKKDILTAYRQKIISLCVFEPKGPTSHTLDEMRVQEYLQTINQYYDYHSPFEAYDLMLVNLVHDFEKDLWLDIQSLSRLLNTAHYKHYLKKFEEAISRKAVEFLGSAASIRIFTEITKDKEFLKQLPLLLEKSDKLKQFISNFPDKKKRDKILNATIYEIFNNKKNKYKNGAVQTKYIQMIQGIMQTPCVD